LNGEKSTGDSGPVPEPIYSLRSHV
jgi:hypothetical protein